MIVQKLQTLFLGACVVGLLLASNVANAQQNAFAGVRVSADGVLEVLTVQDRSGQLTAQYKANGLAKLNADVAVPSQLRKISLNRLEKAIEKAILEGREPTAEMECLAGLQRLQYVFFYPETKDIVIAGPAEGWYTDPTGRLVGLNTGRPVLELRDLVVALRVYKPGKRTQAVIGCSIDPTQEGLAKMAQFLGRRMPKNEQFIVNGLRQNLGLQTVSVTGVPATTHFAQVMVEADYRMKLIGIGLEQPAVAMASYVDLVNPRQVAANAMQRWFFTPNYECVRTSEDGLAMEMVGLGVQLIGEDELVGPDGQRAVAGVNSNQASKKFVDGFTDNYADLAAKTPVYAQLRNLIDMSIAAAYIQDQDLYGAAGWKMDVLGDEELYEVEILDVPAKVESAVNAIWKGNMLMTPIGGGVEIEARRALKSSLTDEDGALGKTYGAQKLELGEGQWWWWD